MHNQNTFTGPSFSFRNRLARMLWSVVELFFFRLSPRPFHEWRSFLLRMFGAKVGLMTHIYPGVKIWAPWNLVIGNNVGIANGVTLYSQGKITIGDRCVISQNSYLCTGSHDYKTREFILFTKPISLSDDCWLAAGVFIHPGIHLPPGVIVGAFSVVNKALPAWSVCSGNPCTFIKNYSKYEH